MNLAIVIGCMIGKSVLKKEGNYNYVYFRVGTYNESTGEPTYVQCKSKMPVAYIVHTKAQEGTPVSIRGTISYDRVRKTNYLYVTYAQILTPSEKEATMDLKEFLEIYKPEAVLTEYKKVVKEQEKKDKCTDMQPSTDMSCPEPPKPI